MIHLARAVNRAAAISRSYPSRFLVRARCLTLSTTLRSQLSSSTATPVTATASISEFTPRQQHQRAQNDDQRGNDSDSQARSRANPLLRLWRWYMAALNNRPYLVQSLTSAFLFAIGDITAQHYEAYLDAHKPPARSHNHGHELIHHHEIHQAPVTAHFSYHRLAACTLFGLCVMGPGGQWWYTKLDILVRRWYKPQSIKNIVTKVALDTAIFNPIFLVVFFSSVSLMEGKSLAEIKHKLYLDFVPSYAVDCSIWPWVQCVNFRFAPVNLQLLIVNLFCYFDDVFLSYVQHNGMPAIFVGIEQWWLSYIGETNGRGHGARRASVSDNSSGQLVAASSDVKP